MAPAASFHTLAQHVAARVADRPNEGATKARWTHVLARQKAHRATPFRLAVAPHLINRTADRHHFIAAIGEHLVEGDRKHLRHPAVTRSHARIRRHRLGFCQGDRVLKAERHAQGSKRVVMPKLRRRRGPDLRVRTPRGAWFDWTPNGRRPRAAHARMPAAVAQVAPRG